MPPDGRSTARLTAAEAVRPDGGWCRGAEPRRAHYPEPTPLSQRLFDPPSQRRQECALEPRVLLHPDLAPPARVREREVPGKVLLEASNRLGQGALRPTSEVVRLGVLTHQQGELPPGHLREQSLMPGRSALGTRRQIATASAPGPAEAHGQDGDGVGIIEGRAVDLQPLPEVVSRVIVPGKAGGVHLGAWRLADDHDAGAAAEAKNGPRVMGKMGRAEDACPCLREENLQRGLARHGRPTLSRAAVWWPRGLRGRTGRSERQTGSIPP